MIALTLIALILSALFSATEIAYVSAGRVRVEIDSQQRGPTAYILRRFYADPDFFISSILVGNNIMLVVYGMGASELLAPYLKLHIHNEGLLLAVQTLVSTAIILLTGEFLPKTMARINPNSSLRFLAPPAFFFYLLFWPVAWFTNAVSDTLMRLFRVPRNEDGSRLLSVGDLNNYLEETIDSLAEQSREVQNEVKIFQNALDFSSTRLRDCMVPRTEIVAVDRETATRRDLVRLFTDTGRSKILVYTHDIDEIVGYIHVSELFNTDVDWHTRIKEVVYAPATLLANKLMRRLLAEKRSLSVVVDEFGGTAGIVTLEDLMEEICGDIRDEHDTAGTDIREIAPDVWEVSGRAEVEAVNDACHLDIPEDPSYQTVAGYLLHATGSLPEAGAVIMLGHLRFDIVSVSQTRINQLRITALPD